MIEESFHMQQNGYGFGRRYSNENRARPNRFRHTGTGGGRVLRENGHGHEERVAEDYRRAVIKSSAPEARADDDVS